MTTFLRIQVCILLASLMLAGTVNAEAQDTTTLSSVSWLEGCWVGEGLGGQIEECWMRAPDGTMSGAFQFMLKGQLVFSEMEMLAQFEDGVAMRVKHFNPNFDQWESDEGKYVDFPLVEMGDTFFQFEGLRYELEGETLSVTLDMHDEAGAVQTESFVMHRK